LLLIVIIEGETMEQENVVAFCMGAAFLLTGCLLTASEKVAIWGLSHGKATIWVKLLGLERAVKLTRYFFGPLTIALGLFGIVLGFRGK
jgi:hypothetical protein